MRRNTFDGNDNGHEDEGEDGKCFGSSSHYSVIQGEGGKFVKASYQVPTCCDVAGNEDADSQGGERVHTVVVRDGEEQYELTSASFSLKSPF